MQKVDLTLSVFSFKCRHLYHAPTDCATIRKWLTKCADDSETANYISAHTKDVRALNISNMHTHVQIYFYKFCTRNFVSCKRNQTRSSINSARAFYCSFPYILMCRFLPSALNAISALKRTEDATTW